LTILPHFRAYIKIVHDIWGRKIFFSKILIRSIQKKIKVMYFGNLILNKRVKNQEKILLFVFLKSAQLWHRIYLGQFKHAVSIIIKFSTTCLKIKDDKCYK